MSARILLVDLESVQPTPAEVENWLGDEGSAWVFHGRHQLKMLPKYTALGSRVTVVPISRPGKNSLDFHLVFYLGYLTARNPDGRFAVLSKDTGYDPAIMHARTLAFDLVRIEGLSAEAGRPAKTLEKAALRRPPAPKPGVTPKKPKATQKAVPAKTTPPPAKKVATKKAAAKKAVLTIKIPVLVRVSKAAPATTAKSGSRTLGAVYRDILQQLRTQVPNRPKSRQALERHVQTQLGPEPAPDKVRCVVDRLFTVEAVRQEGGGLIYFPVEPSDADRARRIAWPATRPAT